MYDIRSWLELMSLGEYAETFESERIRIEQVDQLTEADLKELGLPMGPRKAILVAAAQLAVAGAPDTAPTPAREAERRQITVMFCDLVGSTALSEQLDPEDLRGLMQAYQQAAGAVIERYGGHVAQYLGDGLMTYFGWPRAHEDDAERAVRAGLEIVEAVKAVEAPAPLAVRIGIATGPVVVGETGAGDASVPKLAVGETPNLAARIQGLAGADHVVIGPSTRRLIGGTFELEDLGEQVLKGIVEPVNAWRATAVAATEGRFEAQHQHLTPLVGRAAEMAMVMARWAQARAGEGQVIVLSGEPGIGKSWITQALRDQLADEPHTRLRYQCSPYHTNSALHPVIEHIERAAGFTREDGVEAKLDKLDSLLGGTPSPSPKSSPARGEDLGEGDQKSRALIASLLSLPVERYPALGMSPQKQIEETLKALSDQVTAMAAARPVLLVFEDAHWIDPTSQELLDLILPAIAPHRVLVVITHRPEYDPPWLGQGHVAPLALTRLGRADAAAMVARVSDEPLSDEMLDQIVAKTDGVPLFVEELTKTVLETGAETANAIPETLQDSLMARLDRIEAVKEVAQIGACIGREFSHELLAAVSRLGDNELADALQQLVNSELVHRSGAAYTFKHALVQDVAYGSLLRSKRSQLHKTIGEIFEDRFGLLAENQPEILAHHFSEAGVVEKAILLWLKAGELRIARAGHQEGLAHLERGLALLKAQPNSAARAETELAFQMNIGSANNVLWGWSASEVKVAYGRAGELVNDLTDKTHGVNALLGLFYYYIVAGDVNASTPIIEEAADLAEASGISDQIVVAQQGRGQNYLYRGEFSEAAKCFQTSLIHYDRDTHAYLSNVWGGDMFAYDYAFLALCYWHLGEMGEAERAIQQSIEHVDSFDDPVTHTVGYFMNAIASVSLKAWDDVQIYANSSEKVATSFGMAFHITFCPLLRGCATALISNDSEGHSIFKTNLDMLAANGIGWVNTWLRSNLALSHVMRGESDLAEQELRRARREASAHGEKWTLGLFDIAEAEICKSRGDFQEAENVLLRAIEFSRKQPSKGIELRAATSLARLWQSQGRTGEAHELLFPVYDWFTEGFDTADLKDAKALLDELK